MVTEKATGYPAIGVSVLVKGTTNGTITSMDGDYTLSYVPKNATLVFSYVGMTTQEVPVNGQTVVNFLIFSYNTFVNSKGEHYMLLNTSH